MSDATGLREWALPTGPWRSEMATTSSGFGSATMTSTCESFAGSWHSHLLGWGVSFPEAAGEVHVFGDVGAEMVFAAL